MEEALRDRPEHRQPEPPGVVRMWVIARVRCSRRALAHPARCSRPSSSNMLRSRASMEYSDEGVGAETVEPATGDDSLF